MNISTLKPSILHTITGLPGIAAVVDDSFKICGRTQQWDEVFDTAQNPNIFDLDCVLKKKVLWEEKFQNVLNGRSAHLTQPKKEENYTYRWQMDPIIIEGEHFIYLQRHIAIGPRGMRINFLRDQANKVAGIGYWELDLRTNMIMWSSMTRKIHEVPDDYVPKLESGIKFYKEGESRDTITKCVEAAIADGTGWDVELSLITAKGNEIYVNARGEAQFKNGKCIRLIGTFQDITESVKATTAIRESEERFRATFNNTPIACLLLDPVSLTVVELNSSAERIFGFSRKEFLGLKTVDLTHPEDMMNTLRDVKRLWDGEATSIDIEKRFIHKSGKTLICKVSISINRDGAGKPINLISQINDVTALKQKEKEVKKFIEVTKKQNDRLVSFSHIVSHNLRSHTSNISMLLDFIEMETNADEKKQQFEMLKSASAQLSETIMQLNKVISLDIDIKEKEQINLHDAIKKTVEGSHGLLPKDPFRVINKVPEDFTVLTVPAYLDSILLNFLTNGIKYREKKKDSWLRFSAHSESGKSIINIEDNGLGIDMERHGKKLFGLYKTFHGHPDARGLGLYMTKSQIEVMGGEISVESQPGIGTSFKIILDEKS